MTKVQAEWLVLGAALVALAVSLATEGEASKVTLAFGGGMGLALIVMGERP